MYNRLKIQNNKSTVLLIALILLVIGFLAGCGDDADAGGTAGIDPCANNTNTTESPANKAALLGIITNAITSNTTTNLNFICTAKISDMSELFKNNTNFNGNITNWDTSKVTNMQSMFSNASAFNKDLSEWNVANVVNHDYFADDSTSFTNNHPVWNSGCRNTVKTPLTKGDLITLVTDTIAKSDTADLNFICTSKISDMSELFKNKKTFNGNITNWETSMVTTMKEIFFKANAFNQDISGWNTSKVATTKEMFRDAKAFNQDISEWDTSKVTNMVGMFHNAIVFDQDLSKWNVTNVIDYLGFATGASGLTTDKHPKWTP